MEGVARGRYDGAMTSTARRRWSREVDSEVDGIAFEANGPVLLHGYDRPPGGKWLDDVIPGKLGAFDRHSGELMWLAPCEVGYGRGFGAGLGPDGDVLVLGPSPGGHRIVRMSLSDGELLDAAAIAAFDNACVAPDLCLCATAARIFAVDARGMVEAWEYSREGERYHKVVRVGGRALAVFTKLSAGQQGLRRIDAENGESRGLLLAPERPMIHDLAVTARAVVALTCDVADLLPEDLRPAFAAELAVHPSGPGDHDTLSLVAFAPDAEPGDAPLWYRVLDTQRVEDLPEVSISADSGKLYVERGAYLEALDALTGRPLGEWTVPGLDDQVAWRVADGAGVLAEETRVSVFELPA